MRKTQRRPPVVTDGVDAGVETLPISADPTTPPAAPHDPAAARRPVRSITTVPIRDKLLWDRRDISLLTGVSVRLIERAVSAGRMPGPDIRIGRRALWRPCSVTRWLDELAERGGRSVSR